jgi:hypothetical protein
MTEPNPSRPFDERAALQELERLAEKIQSTRRQRQQAVAEFETFVKTFREDRYEELIATQAAQAAHAAQAAEASRERRGIPQVRPASIPPPVPAPQVVERRMDEPPSHVPAIARPAIERPAIEPSSSRAESPSRATSLASTLASADVRTRIIAAAAVLVLVIIAVWYWSASRANPTPAQPATAAPSSASRAEPPPTPAPAAQPVASSGPPRALNIELVTLRPVWTRVIVDGQKVIERELPKDSRIPLGADRAIAIRAGDAGAIKLVIEGKDAGVLGRDGQIGTRTLTASGAR